MVPLARGSLLSMYEEYVVPRCGGRRLHRVCVSSGKGTAIDRMVRTGGSLKFLGK